MTLDLKGPWRLESHDRYMQEDDPSSPIQIVDRDGDVVACNTSFYPTELTSARAPVIAAAPCLLEELRNARSILVDMENWPIDSPNIVAIDAAIAKAEGRKS